MTLIAARPTPGEAHPYRFPTVVRRGGVVAAHLPAQPLAVAVLLIDAGAGREPADIAGVTGVVLDALQEATIERDAQAYALALERLGATLSTAADWDSVRLGVQVPVEHLDAAVALLAEAVGTPRLDADDVARVRDDAVTARRMTWARPGPRADAALRVALHGPEHRYGRPVHGTPDTVAAVSVGDVETAHERWSSRKATLLVAGDLEQVDLDALGATVGVRSGSVASADGDRPPPAVPRAARQIVLLDRPGAVQSTLRLGHSAPHRSHPDHVAMLLAGTVLGGVFGSRLNHLLRETRGYTYGIRAGFGQSRRSGRFVVSTAVQSAVTTSALSDTVDEIDRTHRDGVSEAELADARTWRAGQLSLDLQTPGAIVRALGELVVHDLPDDYHATLHADLLAADVATVSAAAGDHLRPEQLVMVVQGDAATSGDDLRASGLGDVIEHRG